MAHEEPNFSRTRRKKGRNRSNRILNLLIGIVVVLIIIVASSILLKGGNDQADEKDVADRIELEDESTLGEETEDGQTTGDEDNAGEGKSDQGEDDRVISEERQTDRDDEAEETDSHSPGKVTIVPSTDEVIAETVIDTSWQPIGTTQTGEHVSLYDGKSVDWKEKEKALAYATGLPYDSMIFWKIKNGGGPQQSIGIVSSKDRAEKYRVYLEWVDGQGWKPVKMDVLTTLDFDY